MRRALAAAAGAAAIAGAELPAQAHHTSAFISADIAEVAEKNSNELFLMGSYFRPELGPTTGHHADLMPGYRRGISDDFQFEYHFHWVTDPAKGLEPGESVFEEHGLAVKQVFPEWSGFPMRVAAFGEVELPTAHAVKKVGATTAGKLRLILSRHTVGGLLLAVNLDGLAEVGLRCTQGAAPAMAPRRHTPDDRQACEQGEPVTNLDWGFAVALRKSLSGPVSASVELAKEIDHPPGVTTIIGFHVHSASTWYYHFGVGFPVGLDEDFLSLRLGAGTKF
ncbi:MAG: hypothetical protein HYY13_11785 [Nitrospirae bacterium]|nr:hypothetical protein [Nitrospirota bacterium]